MMRNGNTNWYLKIERVDNGWWVYDDEFKHAFEDNENEEYISNEGYDLYSLVRVLWHIAEYYGREYNDHNEYNIRIGIEDKDGKLIDI